MTVYWVGSPKFTAGHPVPLIALVHHSMVGTLRSTDAAFTRSDGREASTQFGVGYGCGRTGHPTSAHVHQYVGLGDNSRTVSIEHHDNGGRTAGSGKGVVPEAVIAASIALDALLLRGDLAEQEAAGIRETRPTAADRQSSARRLGSILSVAPPPDRRSDAGRSGANTDSGADAVRG